MAREQPARQNQKTNSQAQAGAASQIILNLMFLTSDGVNWAVQPVVVVERENQSGLDQTTQPQGSPASSAAPEGPVTDVGVESQKRSNAQGQGLTVHNMATIAEELRDVLNLAAKQ